MTFDVAVRLPLFVVAGAAVVVLVACPDCTRTMTGRWPAVRRLECAVCGVVAVVALPPPAVA